VAAAITVGLQGLTKRFGSTLALSGVSLTAHGGEVHAVTGENGAGKSTLMKMLGGVHQPDAGQILIDGQAVRLPDPHAARAAGVATVFQELTVIPTLTVAENIHLGHEPQRLGLLDRERMRRQAREVLARLDMPIHPDTPCGELGLGERQMVEVAKGLVSDARVFIFDEPTAALNKAEVDKLAALIAQLRAEGKVVFYISHRLEEIFRFCQTVTVLKDGQWVATEPAHTLDAQRLVALMVGRAVSDLYPPRPARSEAPPALDVRRLPVRSGQPPLAFTLRRGEILGMAGLEGQGQREILRTLAGALPAHGADVLHGTTPLPLGRGVPAVVARGVALVPEERKSEGLYLSLSSRTNMELGLQRLRMPWQRAAREPQVVEAMAAQLHLQDGNLDALAGALSGGNQQKVMLGRWLVAGVDVLLIEQPTRGVDVGAKAEIYRVLRDFCAQGGAVLAVSGDLPELLGLCDRLLVVRDAQIVADLPAEGATEEQIMEWALPPIAAEKKAA
jgi:ribose transport system ATP-binding protein